MNIQGMLAGLALIGILLLSAFFYGKHVGYKERKNEDQKVLLDHKLKEDQLIKEVQDARLQREDKYRKGDSVIHQAKDDSLCFDRPLPDDAYNELLDAANIK
jgi:hypothetical protein